MTTELKAGARMWYLYRVRGDSSTWQTPVEVLEVRGERAKVVSLDGETKFPCPTWVKAKSLRRTN